MKKIRNTYYAHISNFKDKYDWIGGWFNDIPKGYEFNIIKQDNYTGNVSYIYCPDFDTENEPRLLYSLTFDHTHKLIRDIVYSPDNPPIYHHKWMFVKEDYKGFDISQAKLRSDLYKSLLTSYDKKRIGRLIYWKEFLEKHNLSL